MWLLNHRRDLACIHSSSSLCFILSVCPFQMLMATQLQKKAGYSLFQREPIWSLWPFQVRHWCIIQLVNNLLSDPACMQVMWGVWERENEGTWNMNKCFNVSLTSFLCSHWRLFVFLFSVYVIMYSWHICSSFGLSPFCTPTWIQLWKTDPYLLLWLCGAQLNVDNSKGICIEMSYKLPPVFFIICIWAICMTCCEITLYWKTIGSA